MKGRGSDGNLPNRFERLAYAHDPEVTQDGASSSPRTEFYKDHSRTILTQNNSPDVGFTHSINPYRGCEHGCIYCYARPTHEYLGLSAGLDFETKIFVKEDAPALLRERLMAPSWKPETIAVSGVTDCYQPAERRFRITRQCLEVMAEFRNPFAIITKNHLVTRDIDLLTDMARDQAAAVTLSLTTLDDDLCGKLEPRTSRPRFRLKAVEELARAGIPVGVNLAPMIPGLTDREIPALLAAAADAGAKWAGYTPVRLPLAVAPLFEDWLERHLPEARDRVLGRIRDVRGGKLNDSRFGSRMQGEGEYAEQIGKLFELHVRRHRLNEKDFDLSTAAFRRPGEQLRFF